MNSVVLTASSQTLNSAVPHMLKFLYDPTHYLPCASSYGDLIEKCARVSRPHKVLKILRNNNLK